ncbi:MAG: MlaD family protein, partial [Candidatus Latescibacterota bacterium]
LLAVMTLFAGAIWLKEYNPAAKAVKRTILFRSANGITSGDPVLLAGVKVGEVEGVSLTEDNLALIAFTVREGIDLRPDAVFRIADVGFLGDKALVIEPGSASGNLNEEIVLRGDEAVGLETLITDARKMLNRLDHFVAEVDSELDIARLSTSVDVTLWQLREAASSYGSIAERNRRTIDALLRNLNELSANLNTFVAANDGQASETVGNINRAAIALAQLAEDLRPLGVVADSLASSMQTGQGTLVKLLRSDEFYEELRGTNALIDSLLVDIRRNPELYLKNLQFKFELF